MVIAAYYEIRATERIPPCVLFLKLLRCFHAY